MLADWFHKHPGGLKKCLSENSSTKHPRFFDITGTSFTLLAKSYNAQAKSAWTFFEMPLKLEVLSIGFLLLEIEFTSYKVLCCFYSNKNKFLD